MNVNIRVLGAGVLFFLGQNAVAQKTKRDTTVSTKNIEEVVVLGYSKTATKAKSTASSTTVSAEALENRPNASFLNSLQGQAPGISINSSSGTPGSGKISVMVRGLSSLNASSDPLYVIDGLATSATQFRNLNTNDIETISVLRDAAATSVYGNRGANGVVVITTKTGKFNAGLVISYDATTGVATLPAQKYHLSNATQYLKIKQLSGVKITDREIENNAINTDWKKVFFRSALTQQHNLGLRIGGKNVSVYSSIGYLEQEGMVRTTDFKRFTFRNNINGRSNNGKLTYNTQIALGYSRRNELEQETQESLNSNIVQNPLHGYLLGDPTLPKARFSSGQDMFNQIGSNTNENRFVWLLEDYVRSGNFPSYTDENSILANTAIKYKINDDFSIGNKLGFDYKQSDLIFAQAPWSYLAIDERQKLNIQFTGSELMTDTKDFTFNNVLNATFQKSFADHSVELGGYFEYIKAHYLFKSQEQTGLNPNNWRPGSGTGYVPFNPENQNQYIPKIEAQKINAGSLAYFLTADYDYSGKYGFSGVVRRDGTYRFTKANKWGTFWSLAGRWNVDKEFFMADSTFDMLKLRASYGTQGNQNLIPPINNLNPMFSAIHLGTDLNDFGKGYLNMPSYYFAQLGNPNLHWEKLAQFNVGVDFRLLNRTLEGTFDYYVKSTDDMFNKLRLSAITGQYEIDANNGKLKNMGLELMLRYYILNHQDYKLSVFANAAYNKNKIVELEEGDQLLSGNTIVNSVGNLAYQWNLYRYAGVNKKTGEMQFYAKDGSITEAPTDQDRFKTGKSYYPKYQGGFGVNASYKGFYLDALFSWQAKSWQMDNTLSWLYDASAIGITNLSSDMLGSWTPNNMNASMPSLKAKNSGMDTDSDRYLYSTAFVKLKSLTLGYTVPKTLLKDTAVRSLKIFLQGENLTTWTKWRGFDPEGIGEYSLSIYPNPRTVSVGINVEL
ncbi:SusC/RagA family TonB-linked outer membrane protein [Elizabethkingia argentiflava]|uniref:SusC/RagA family TonB-linked outer membrane protein n=1 Tax=Elizabethkingia argenteiflava TaxID=2681556 RepID=A0A845PYP2_9FLAO|nr:SusC/RagA family TonB-linked outer membrane protein [Elizabethkingia argenteiflava]NAW52031.1 SusC/RagA family TonB-linked outer membrane protein [Elizabethkingia argenteiflava]